MTRIAIMRTEQPIPAGSVADAVRGFLFGVVDGFTSDDKKAWAKFWRRLTSAEPGEIVNVEMVFPRSGPYHRRHMRIEQSVFDAQERFIHFEQFRYWLKVGAGWVDWCAGPKGGVVPVPRSISYAKADQEEFRRYHDAVIEFLRGPHAARYLWPHLEQGIADDMMDQVLRELSE